MGIEVMYMIANGVKGVVKTREEEHNDGHVYIDFQIHGYARTRPSPHRKGGGPAAMALPTATS